MNINPIIQQINNIDLNDDPVPMKTGKAKNWLGEYHWVTPKMLKSETIKPKTNEEIKDWCMNQFGKTGHKWFEKDNTYYFKNEEDMTMFVLRWS